MKTRILIADDDARLRSELRNLILAVNGMEVVAEAENGQEAVRLAMENDVDVVILDVAMPRMSGVDAAKLIHTAKQDVRIVAVSMHAKETYKKAMSRAGASAYVLKNKLGSDLIPAIDAMLSQSMHALKCLGGNQTRL